MAQLLLPNLARAGGRVVSVSSVAYKWSAMSEETQLIYAQQRPDKCDYGRGLIAYAESKLAWIIWSRHMASVESHVSYASVHPGVCNTGLFAYSVSKSVIDLCSLLGLVRRASEGADSILHVIQAPLVKSGALYADGNELEIKLSPTMERTCANQIISLLSELFKKIDEKTF